MKPRPDKIEVGLLVLKVKLYDRFYFEVRLHATVTSKVGPMKEDFEAADTLETIPMVAPFPS